MMRQLTVKIDTAVTVRVYLPDHLLDLFKTWLKTERLHRNLKLARADVA